MGRLLRLHAAHPIHGKVHELAAMSMTCSVHSFNQPVFLHSHVTLINFVMLLDSEKNIFFRFIVFPAEPVVKQLHSFNKDGDAV